MTGGERQRLCANTLARAHAETVPEYDRSATPGIAHLGFGAFARAHLAVYADELLRLGRPALIRGVSIRSRRTQYQLEPQDGLFTVATREPGQDMSLHVVGALASMETGPAAALDALDRAGRQARDTDHHGEGLSGGGGPSGSVGTSDLGASPHRLVPGPAPPSGTGTSDLRITRQPPREWQHAANARPRGGRDH